MNVDSVLDDVTSGGREFHVRDAAAGKARSPMVRRRVEGTTTADVDDERRRRVHIMYLVHTRTVRILKMARLTVMANVIYGDVYSPIKADNSTVKQTMDRRQTDLTIYY